MIHVCYINILQQWLIFHCAGADYGDYDYPASTGCGSGGCGGGGSGILQIFLTSISIHVITNNIDSI